MLTTYVDEQKAQDKHKFLQDNIDKILTKRLEHSNESGYVCVFTNCNFELESLKFKSKKSFKAEKFRRVDLIEVSENETLTGKLYFKVVCKEADRSSKLYCDFNLTEENHSDINIVFEAIDGMITEENKGVKHHELTDYQQYFKLIHDIEEDHPFGREMAYTLAALLITQIVALKLRNSGINDSQWLNGPNRDDEDLLMEWMDESKKLMNEDDDEL